uniref:ERI1 exoribonuclease 2 n=1 Tax=Periophthalmus magnuspinnatus TaxID=409849 RepID=A0A3B4AKN8_9GOBI
FLLCFHLRELGLLRQRSNSSGSKKLVSNQVFAYIIVIDFESTCWKEKNNYGQEIIEFPAVLLNTSTGEVESEFHSYVQPQEHPVLSEFCTELTGITQNQVEAGVPLQICLSRFNRWLQRLQHQKGLVFSQRQHSIAQPIEAPKLCTFLTWSDWDLGVCLLYECKRKQINKPSVLNSWIDLRSTYRLFYNRKPKGLNGALQDLGIQFEGREHSGLDDARNTAQLAARMMREGCVLRVTRSLDRVTKQNEVKDQGTATTKLSSTSFLKPGLDHPNSTVNPSSVQSLVSPKTLLNGTTVLREPCQSTKTSPKLSAITVNMPSHSLTPNTAGCVQFLPHSQPFITEGSFEELVVESEERCGSYDDVVLDSDVSEFERSSYSSDESVCVSKPIINTTASISKNIQNANQEGGLKPGLETCFAVPKPVSKPKLGHCPSEKGQMPYSLLNKSDTSFRLANLPKAQVLVSNTPTVLKPKTTQSFSIYTDSDDPDSSTSRPSFSKSVLSNLSINSSLNRTWVGGMRKGESRITSPLCACGRRAKRQTVSNGGPNQGRAFFCCPRRRSSGRDRAPSGCGFFKWESAVLKNSSVGTAAVQKSVSVCYMNTTVSGRQHNSLRKSF